MYLKVIKITTVKVVHNKSCYFFDVAPVVLSFVDISTNLASVFFR